MPNWYFSTSTRTHPIRIRMWDLVRVLTDGWGRIWLDCGERSVSRGDGPEQARGRNDRPWLRLRQCGQITVAVIENGSPRTPKLSSATAKNEVSPAVSPAVEKVKDHVRGLVRMP